MNASRTSRLLLVAFLCSLSGLRAEPIRVRHVQGAAHGFLVLRSETGAVIAHGDMTQLAEGDRVTTRLTFHFRDGSLDDETTVFTQRGNFALLSDHHIQRGPFFSTATDATISAAGDVIVKSTGKDGSEKVESSHLDFPPDVSNGFVATILANLPANGPEFHLGYFVPTGKGRLIKLRVTSDAKSTVVIAGERRSTNVFRLHPELGGITGVVAPLVGKQPDDILIYVVEGECPAIVREVGQMYEGGPTVSLELAGTAFAPVSGAKASH